MALCLVATGARAQWFVEVGAEHFDWREHTTPIVVHESGPRFSFGAGVMQRKASGPLIGYHGQIYGGNVDYEGSFQFDATQAASGTSVYLGTTQSGEARWRWPDALDAVVGLDYDVWRRELSTTQDEHYRIWSMRLGVERVASASSPFVIGGGMRFLVSTDEDATIEDSGVTYELSLSPGLGTNPYVQAGYRVKPHLTVLGFYDGMSLGRSNRIILLKRGKPQAVVTQPDTDMTRIGLRLVYGW